MFKELSNIQKHNKKKIAMFKELGQVYCKKCLSNSIAIEGKKTDSLRALNDSDINKGTILICKRCKRKWEHR